MANTVYPLRPWLSVSLGHWTRELAQLAGLSVPALLKSEAFFSHSINDLPDVFFHYLVERCTGVKHSIVRTAK